MQRAHRDDVAAIVAIVAVLLPLYLATMYPDVLGSGDSAKFQYLGRVLGTAHSPGYPAFVMLTHLYSYVPIGTLAWRMNFCSVLCALAALAASFGAARRLGAGAASAALLAIACGTGLVFWNGSLAAEVYPLNALLVTVAIWRVLAWRDSRYGAP